MASTVIDASASKQPTGSDDNRSNALGTATSPKTIMGFDLYGTLLSTRSIADELAKAFGEETAGAIAATWRQRQLEYTWRLNSMEEFLDFAQVTRRSLLHAVEEHKKELPNEETILKILSAYNSLSIFPDVGLALAALQKDTSIIPIIFSNGTAEMVTKSVRNSKDLSPYAAIFREIITVDNVRKFKPHPAVYQHLISRCEALQDQWQGLWLVSANPFDIVGAKKAGIKACWITRDNEVWSDKLIEGVIGKADREVNCLKEALTVISCNIAEQAPMVRLNVIDTKLVTDQQFLRANPNKSAQTLTARQATDPVKESYIQMAEERLSDHKATYPWVIPRKRRRYEIAMSTPRVDDCATAVKRAIEAGNNSVNEDLEVVEGRLETGETAEDYEATIKKAIEAGTNSVYEGPEVVEERLELGEITQERKSKNKKKSESRRRRRASLRQELEKAAIDLFLKVETRLADRPKIFMDILTVLGTYPAKPGESIMQAIRGRGESFGRAIRNCLVIDAGEIGLWEQFSKIFSKSWKGTDLEKELEKWDQGVTNKYNDVPPVREHTGDTIEEEDWRTSSNYNNGADRTSEGGENPGVDEIGQVQTVRVNSANQASCNDRIYNSNKASSDSQLSGIAETAEAAQIVTSKWSPYSSSDSSTSSGGVKLDLA